MYVVSWGYVVTDVIVVGGGPTGLLLAGELRLAGADPLVLEAADGAVRQSRSLGMRGLNSRTSRSLGLRGLTEPLARAQEAIFERLAADRTPADADQVRGLLRMLLENRARGHFSGLPLVVDEADRSGVVEHFLVTQHQLERILAEWAAVTFSAARSWTSWTMARWSARPPPMAAPSLRPTSWAPPAAGAAYAKRQ